MYRYRVRGRDEECGGSHLGNLILRLVLGQSLPLLELHHDFPQRRERLHVSAKHAVEAL